MAVSFETPPCLHVGHLRACVVIWLSGMYGLLWLKGRLGGLAWWGVYLFDDGLEFDLIASSARLFAATAATFPIPSATAIT